MPHRRESRLPIARAAKIVLADGCTAIDCAVLDISASGGCVEVIDEVALPVKFQLVPGDGDPTGYACRVVWRRDGRVGVEFD